MKTTHLATLVIFALWLACGRQSAQAQPVPEKLTYDLSWNGIKIGKATQEIVEVGQLRRITSTARSNAWLSMFFPVDNRIESTLAKDRAPFPGATLRYRMQLREGKNRREREIFFSLETGRARYIDHLSGEKLDIPFKPGTYDIYASFFHVRYAPLEVGKSLHVNVLDGRETDDIEVQVLRKERINSVLGAVDTIVIRPLVKPKGVFEGKGSVLIWLTDDARRIPVRMQTGVKVGSVTATLVE